MYRGKSKKTSRGAVSVFLTVILVPCIALSGLFIDIGRVRLAGALAAAAGDLALDSLLTRYDGELCEFYGLMASCQDIEGQYTDAAGRFAEILDPRLPGNAETETILAQIRALGGGGAISDLLGIDILTDAAEMIAAVPKANMANPEIVRGGVVSFMKYRAPAGLLLDGALPDKLRGEGGELADSAKNQPLTETRHAYYEADGALRDRAYGVYEKLREYRQLAGEPPGERLEGALSELAEYRETYERIHAIIAADVCVPPSDAGGGTYAGETVLEGGLTVDETIYGMSVAAARHRDAAARSKALLDDASQALGALGGYLQPLKDSFSDWGTAASSAGTSMAGTHMEEIAGIRDNTNIDAINEGSVSQLKARIDVASAAYGALIAGIDAMRYGSARVLDIAGYEDAVSASGMYGRGIGEGETFDAFVRRTFSYAPASGAVIDAGVPGAEGVDLARPPAAPLYTWMESEFRGVDGGTRRRSDEKMGEYQNMGSSESEDAKRAGDTQAGELTALAAPEFPSGFDGEAMAALAGLGNVAALAGALAGDFEGALTDMRDAFFAAEYCSGMFSHYTYEKEARYSLLPDGDREGITWQNSGEYYARVTGDARTRGTWLSADAGDVYNKSLTGRLINSANNYAYGAELEYILYGGKNADNIGRAISSIYALRYILNAPYAFTAFWGVDNNTGRAINAAAAAISAWSGGVVPEPLVKSVIILALVALETANDVQMLKAGLPVKLIKVYAGGEGDPEWAVQLRGDGEGGVAPSTRGNTSAGSGAKMTYGDYIYIFMLLGFYGGGELSASMYARAADIVQVNVRLAAGGDVSADYVLERAAVYFNIEAEVRAAPLMLSLPITSGHGGDGDGDWYTFKYRATRGYGG
ncbi:MAG: DUF5702 domain-containing protein [Oscillospiraceae bacterium]|jgi:hypothetical protein|nr:DUF5702 domain-containing protein [Oscillospiraceae bacterium]